MRAWVLATAANTGTTLESVERSLYLLAGDKRVQDVEGRTWQEYGKILRSNLRA